MTKFLTVCLAAACLMGGAGQAQADSVAMENWQVVFTTDSNVARVHGSIHWIDNKNPNKPTYMDTVDAISQASKDLTLPAGAIVSATGSSNAITPVLVKIYRNRVECDDAPDPTKSFSNSKTCSK